MEDVLWHPWLTGHEDVISESVTGLNSCRIWCDALGQVTSSDHSVIFLLFCRGVEDNSEDSSPGLAWKRGSSEHPMQGIARLLKKLKGEMHWNLDKGIHYLGPICWGIQDKSIHVTWDGSCATRLFPDVSEWRLPSFSRPRKTRRIWPLAMASLITGVCVARMALRFCPCPGRVSHGFRVLILCLLSLAGRLGQCSTLEAFGDSCLLLEASPYRKK